MPLKLGVGTIITLLPGGGASVVDSTPPTITSANAASVQEGQPLVHALTADETVNWSKTGGADAARFEISGNVLRWLGNGTKVFATPDDADVNNVYVVQVTATDLSLNATPQTISVTVTEAPAGFTPKLDFSDPRNSMYLG